MYSDREIIIALKDEVKYPDPTYTVGYKVLRNMIDPIGIRLTTFRNTDLNYTAYHHLDEGVFCVIAIKTLFSRN